MELRMRHSPSVVPSEGGVDTYLVLEDLGHFGRSGARPLKRMRTTKR
jgi:hypothetical protein